jgi:hypothetical protein
MTGGTDTAVTVGEWSLVSAEVIPSGSGLTGLKSHETSQDSANQNEHSDCEAHYQMTSYDLLGDEDKL